MEFFNSSTKVLENDNWGGDAAIQTAVSAVQAFPFSSTGAKDAAIFGAAVGTDSAHSIKISARGGVGGTVIAELYDATASGQFTTTTPRLINVSVLKNVGDLTTMGFFVGGSTSVQVLVRAVGPSLGAAPFNLGGTMADPKMDLFPLGGNTAIASNNDWGGTTELKAAFHAVGAFGIATDSKDAALLQTLPPGGYTVQVKSNVSGQTGIAIIEVYEVP
jgi:hypothetical protein